MRSRSGPSMTTVRMADVMALETSGWKTFGKRVPNIVIRAVVEERTGGEESERRGDAHADRNFRFFFER